MVKAQLSGGQLLLGLSRINIERLMLGQAIVFDGRPFGLPDEVCIMFGETEESIMADIMRNTGVAGRA